MTSLIKKSDSQFFVYLLSSASMKLAPQNTLTKFRNYLVDEIYLKKSDNWYISLQTLFMSNVSEEGTNKNNVIKVECPQIHQNIGEQPVLSVHARTVVGSEHVFEANVKQYFRPENERISFIDINICNTDDSLLNLVSDQPTVIVLEFKKMDPFRNTHTLRVSNRDIKSNAFKSSNTSTNFRVKVPQEFTPQRLHNRPPWDIALTSLTYEPNFLQAAPKTNAHKVYMFLRTKTRKRKKIDSSETGENDQILKRMQQTNSLQKSPSESVHQTAAAAAPEEPVLVEKSIEEVLLEENRIMSEEDSDDGQNEQPEFATNQIRRERRSVSISQEKFVTMSAEVYTSKKKLSLKMISIFRSLARLVGVDVDLDVIHDRVVLDCTDSEVDFGMAMPEYFANMLGLPIDKRFWKEENYVCMYFKPGTVFRGEVIDFNANIPRTLLIYVNCVEPSFVGNVYVPVLKSIPVKRRDVGQNRYVTYEPRHLEFKKMAFSGLDYLHFRFLKLNGEEIDATTEININMTLTLKYVK
jgi:hypothetical protein